MFSGTEQLMSVQLTNTPQLSAAQTHGIPTLGSNRLLTDSRGRGWPHLYAALTAERPWEAELRPLPHDCLVYCVSGQVEVQREVDLIGPAAEARLLPRGISLIPAGVASRWRITGTPEILLVYLHAELKAQLAAELGLPNTNTAALLHPLLAVSDPLLEQICLALMRSLREGTGKAHAAYVDQLARTAMMHLLLNHRAAEAGSKDEESFEPVESTASADLSRALAYIEARLGDSLSVASLAQVAGVSEAHFTRLFVRRIGMPPHRYILRARVERAMDLLSATRKPIVEIAAELGFSTQSHFTAAFKRITGITPTEYRRHR